MGEQKSFLLLFLVLTAVTILIGAIALGSRYRDAIDRHGRDLAEAVRLQAALYSSADGSGSGTADAAAGPQVQRLLGRHGRLRLVRRTGDRVAAEVIAESLAPPAESPPPAGEATGMLLQRALSQPPATLVTRDEHGREVLAAHRPVVPDAVALVADIDMTAVRTSVNGGWAVLVGSALLLLSLGGSAIFAVCRHLAGRIRDGEIRYRQLFENLQGGATVYRAVGIGEDFVIADLNRGAERIDHLHRQDVLGQKVSEAFPSVKSTGFLDVLRRVWRTGTAEHVSPTLHQDDRIAGWRESDVYRLPNGDVVGLHGDVTDRKKAEEALKDGDARWRSITEMHAFAVIIIDDNHEIRFANKAAETLFGKSAQELVGAPFGFPVVQGDVADIEIIRPGRSIAFAEMRAVPMRWSGRESFLLFIQDVSAYKRAEGDLRKLFMAIEQSPASVVITDIDGRIEYVNPKFTETTGYTYAEVVGKNPRILKSGHTPPDEYTRLWKTIRAGDVWRGEMHNQKKGGELFWALASIAPVRDATGKITHFVSVTEDITERKATEERLRLSQRMEVIGQLTGGLAHDFNNLLAIILGNLQLIEERIEHDTECRELLADAIWSAERGAQLTHRLLAFARRQRLTPSLTDLNSVVGDMTDLLRRTLGERIEIRAVLAPGLWKTMIDRGQLESALINLVVNARDAMPDGGTLTIATDNTMLQRGDEPTSEEIDPGRYVMLAVGDTGGGMPPEILERIFEPFFTTKRFGQGSGLGLSMVYGFVRQSGGHIVVDSEVGIGTTVKLFLPRAVGEGARDDAVEAAAGTHASSGETILVVEDDARVRRIAASILRKSGYRVLEATDAKEAMAVVEGTPQIDLLFTDVLLPNGIDGTQLARQVVVRRPDTRILFTSGYASEIAADVADLGRPADLLPKPYRRNDLTRKVREVLDHAPPAAAPPPAPQPPPAAST